MLANKFISRIVTLFLCVTMLAGTSGFAQTTNSQTPTANTQTTVATPKETYITNLLAKIKDNGRTVTELSTSNLSKLPLGVKKDIANNEIILAIDSAWQVPGGILINVYTSVKVGESPKKICFEAKRILITPAGISAGQSTKLMMISEFNIPISDKVHLVLPADGSNYVEWDCKGFKSVNLKGLFKFSGDFVPDPELSKNATEVTAAFEAHVTDPSDIVASVSITPFRIAGMGDMAFVVSNASVDMSDFANALGFVFPAAYNNPYKEMPNLWRGFFLKDLKVYLPSELSSEKGRTEIDVHNMLIDESGVSGSFSVTPVLSFGDGDASGWPFSVDKLGITITQNNLTGGLLSGKLGVPFLGNDTIGYAAQVEGTKQGLKYTFSVTTTKATRTFNLPFGGGLQLDKGSIIQVELLNGKFVPSAMLNGILLLENDAVKAKGIRFEQLHLTTQAPYLLGGKFAVASSIGFKIQNFSFCIDSISLGIMNGKASLEFNVMVALMNSSKKGISAWARFEVTASVERTKDPVTNIEGKQHWQYDGVRIKTMGIDCELSIFTLKGSLTFYKNDAVYGNGFHGEVEFTIKKIVPRPVSVEIYFGTKDDYKYWFVKVSIPVRIQIGTVTLLRITGGAYDHMKRKDQTSAKPVYIPDGDCGIGFIAEIG